MNVCVGIAAHRRRLPQQRPWRCFIHCSMSMSAPLPARPRNFPCNLPKRIIFGSCSDASMDLSYWDLFRSLKPDLVVLMGDNVYGRSSNLQDEYRKLAMNPSFQKAKQELCILAALDDNDYSDGGGGTTEVESSQKSKAIALFKDIFRPNLVNNEAAYQSYQWTDQLLIILLDLRCSSSPRLPGSGVVHHVPDYHDKTKTWLGKDQWEWFEKELEKDVRHRIIVSPLQVISTGHSFDCWNQLPYERTRLLQLLQKTYEGSNTATQTILLSGDRHVSAMYYQDGIYEITSSSLTHSVPQNQLDHEIDYTRQSAFIYDNNFGMLELCPQQHQQSMPVRVSIHCAKNGAILQQWQLP